ncbi:MAG: hypothetical protein ACHQ0J_12885 [Candidatus Dormibacterales bacterium]
MSVEAKVRSGRLAPHVKRLRFHRDIFVLVLAAMVLGSEVWPAPPQPAPLVGFSFSPQASELADRDPLADLAFLVGATDPDLVRLPIYWEMVEPKPDQLDFSSIDAMLDVVASHNVDAARSTRVVLSIGARNFLTPELHEPAWAGPRQQPQLGEAQAGAAYRSYIDQSITRYRSSPLLYAWQVENEPFDAVTNATTGEDRITTAQMNWEVGEVHRLDPAHEAVTTTFDAWNAAVDELQEYAPPLLAMLGGYPSGHPGDALAAADALGLDIYLNSPSTPLRFASVALRAEWKAQAIHFWAGQAAAADKSVWLAEMQAAPWGTTLSGFNPPDLLASASIYRHERIQVVLLWGADTWLKSSAWLSAANQAMSILREPQAAG